MNVGAAAGAGNVVGVGTDGNANEFVGVGAAFPAAQGGNAADAALPAFVMVVFTIC